MHLFECGYSDFTVKWATLEWEKAQALELRRQVFCIEQGLFSQHDLDDVDVHAQCLVAVANHGGWPEKVVGTVRIHRDHHSVWWGSRLAVARECRHQSGLGAALIKLAVGSAHGLGCTRFFAQVQKQNETLFHRLAWQSHYEVTVRERPHVMMAADLTRYPPLLQPESGFVLKGGLPSVPEDIAPCLLYRLNHPNESKAGPDGNRLAHHV